MPNATLTDSNSIEYDASNPFPVTATGGGPGGIQQVEIVDNSGNPLTYPANSPVNVTQIAGVNLPADNAPYGTSVPVPVGGDYNATLPTFANLDRGTLQITSRGHLLTATAQLTSAADGVSNTGSLGLVTGSNTAAGYQGVFNLAFNGTTWDRQRMDTAANGGALVVREGPFALGRATTDQQIKGSAGFIHTITIAPLTATPTAGLLTVYDSTTETGTVVYAEWVFATTPGHTVTLDVPCGTGIYVGFDGALANVQVTVAYR